MTMFFDITKMSMNGLKGMHRAIHDRLVEEDNQPQGQEKIYDVRGQTDWREQADEMEAELTRRGIPFTPVPW